MEEDIFGFIFIFILLFIFHFGIFDEMLVGWIGILTTMMMMLMFLV